MATQRICCVEGCDKPFKSKGYCAAHYQQIRRHGRLVTIVTSPGKAMKFIHEVALVCSSDDCLIWPYGRYHKDSYGAIRLNGRAAYVHRYVCELVHGLAPTNKHHVAHGCGERACCNPRHLRWATPTENHADRYAHGTHVQGESHPRAKMTEADVVKIRELSRTMSQRQIGELFDMSQMGISNIITRARWKHVK